MDTTITPAQLAARLDALRLDEEADFSADLLARLAKIGIETIGGLLDANRADLQAALTAAELADVDTFTREVLDRYELAA